MDWSSIARTRLMKAEAAAREAEAELRTQSPEAKARYAYCLQELERARRFAARRPPEGPYDGRLEGVFG